MCKPADTKPAAVTPPIPSLGSGMAQQSKLLIQGRKQRLDALINQSGG